MTPSKIDRRTFLERTAIAGGALTIAGVASPFAAPATAAETPTKRVRVGIIGCGSVSGVYLPHLAKCPYAELVSTCDIIPERAERRAKEHDIANHYPAYR